MRFSYLNVCFCVFVLTLEHDKTITALNKELQGILLSLKTVNHLKILNVGICCSTDGLSNSFSSAKSTASATKNKLDQLNQTIATLETKVEGIGFLFANYESFRTENKASSASH